MSVYGCVPHIWSCVCLGDICMLCVVMIRSQSQMLFSGCFM